MDCSKCVILKKWFRQKFYLLQTWFFLQLLVLCMHFGFIPWRVWAFWVILAFTFYLLWSSILDGMSKTTIRRHYYLVIVKNIDIAVADISCRVCFGLFISDVCVYCCRIPYYLTFSRQYPGKFMLSYLPRKSTRHEFVTVTPEGIRYRARTFPALASMIRWFKEHFRDPIPGLYLCQCNPVLICVVAELCWLSDLGLWPLWYLLKDS